MQLFVDPAVSKIMKCIYWSSGCTSYFRDLRSFYMFTSLFFKQNYFYQVLSHSVDFKAPKEHWNPLIKAVPGYFHDSGGQSKHNCSQDWASFHRSWVRQLLIFYIKTVYFCVCVQSSLFKYFCQQGKHGETEQSSVKYIWSKMRVKIKPRNLIWTVTITCFNLYIAFVTVHKVWSPDKSWLGIKGKAFICFDIVLAFSVIVDIP